MSEYKNMFKGMAAVVVLMLAAILVLSRAAYYTGSGTAAYQESLLFVVLQTIAVMVCYGLWYRKTNRAAADIIRVSEMRRRAVRYRNRYLPISIGWTLGIALAAVICMLLRVIFVEIPLGYCLLSIFLMFILGNAAFYVLTTFLALPNRITGFY